MTLYILILFLFSLISQVACERDNKPLSDKEEDEGIYRTIEQGPAQVTIEVNNKEISIAEHLNLTISIAVPEGYEIDLPGFGEKLEQFGIIDYQTPRPELVDKNKIRTSRSYVLEPFLAGDYTIPSMVISYWEKEKKGSNTNEIKTPEIVIKVKTLLHEGIEEAKLNDVRPPVPFPYYYNIRIWPEIGIVIILLIILVIFLIIKGKKSVISFLENKISPHELAYLELEELIKEDLINKGEIKLFYQRISWIIRCYIENCFGLHAPEQTTEEFLEGLEYANDFEEKYKSLLKAFLKQCDLVKFAKHHPEAETIQNTIDSCKAFIKGNEIDRT